MKSPTRPMIAITVGAAILIALIAFAWYQSKQSTPTSSGINSFGECEAAGYPIMESYPRQCRANDQTFVEEIPSEPDNGSAICVNTCGDGQCAEIVCLGTGCPCAETTSSCPADCGAGRE